MALLERQVIFKRKDKSGNTYMEFPVTRVDYVEGAVASVNGKLPDNNQNIQINTLDTKSTNPITAVSNDTVAKWIELGAGEYFFNASYLNDQPTTSGFLSNRVTDTHVFQLFKSQPSGALYYRDGNSTNGWTSSWVELLVEQYTLPTATASTLGGVTIGSNITNTNGKISLTKANVTNALGYTPLQTAPVTSVNGKTGAVTINNLLSSATNPITSTSDDTVTKWVELGAGVYYFSVSGYLTDQPSQYGILVNFIAGNNVFQIWKGQPNGDMYTRGGNANGWSGTWKVMTNCLPLSGGTMTGSIGLAGGKAVYGTDTSSFIELKAGQNSTDGGRVTVIGKGHESAGQVWLVAHDGTNSSTLIASPNGSLKWANKNVVRSVNGTSADASGNVTLNTGAYVTDTWTSGKNWYRKYSDGWIEQGGEVTTTAQYTTFTLNTAMTTTNFHSQSQVIDRSNGNTINAYIYSEPKSKTQLEVGAYSSGMKVRWYVCGK